MFGVALGDKVGRARALRGAKSSKRDDVNMLEVIVRLFPIVVWMVCNVYVNAK